MLCARRSLYPHDSGALYVWQMQRRVTLTMAVAAPQSIRPDRRKLVQDGGRGLETASRAAAGLATL
jgi:hypothetical protein